MIRLSYQFLIAGEKIIIQDRKNEKYSICEDIFLTSFVTDYVLLGLYSLKGNLLLDSILI
jgi:hypothetical protein